MYSSDIKLMFNLALSPPTVGYSVMKKILKSDYNGSNLIKSQKFFIIILNIFPVIQFEEHFFY